MKHITHMNETYHTYEGVWHIYERVMARMRTSHGTQMKESCHTYQ